MTDLNKEKILQLFRTNDKAIARALVRITERQTQDEQRSGTTKYRNGRGFRPYHARMGTSMANFFLRNGYLTPQQANYWRVRDKKGNMRIGIYANQILEAVREENAKST